MILSNHNKELLYLVKHNPGRECLISDKCISRDAVIMSSPKIFCSPERFKVKIFNPYKLLNATIKLMII